MKAKTKSGSSLSKIYSLAQEPPTWFLVHTTQNYHFLYVNPNLILLSAPPKTAARGGWRLGQMQKHRLNNAPERPLDFTFILLVLSSLKVNLHVPHKNLKHYHIIGIQ